MCDLCNQPDLTVEDNLEHVRSRLTRERFVIQSVAGSVCRAEFSYSVGLTGHGLPELIVTGARRADAARLVDLWGTYLLDESIVLPGERMHSGPFVMEAVAVESSQDHLLLATAVYGDTVRALQLAWADGRGRWPWEQGHRARHAGQPLLGRRAPQYCEEHRPDRLDVPLHP